MIDRNELATDEQIQAVKELFIEFRPLIDMYSDVILSMIEEVQESRREIYAANYEHTLCN